MPVEDYVEEGREDLLGFTTNRILYCTTKLAQAYLSLLVFVSNSCQQQHFVQTNSTLYNEQQGAKSRGLVDIYNACKTHMESK